MINSGLISSLISSSLKSFKIGFGLKRGGLGTGFLFSMISV